MTKGTTPMKLEVTTASVAGGAATSDQWLPKAEESVSMWANPFWAEILPTLGVAWLLIQIGFFLYEKLFRNKKQGQEDNE